MGKTQRNIIKYIQDFCVTEVGREEGENSQNQDFIAKMEEQGLADASLLKKMGFEVEKSGDKLILKSNNDIPPPVSTLCKLSPVPPRKLSLQPCDLGSERSL